MIYLLLIIAVASGAALVPAVGGALAKASGKPAARIRRWAQYGLFGSLIIFSLFVKAIPLTALLVLVAAGVIGTGILREKMIGEELQDKYAGGTRTAPPPAATGKMSREEALSVLGLTTEANDKDIDVAWKKLISQIHPDKGGTDYLAAKINEAREVLKK